MKKSERIAAFVEQLGSHPVDCLDPSYVGYFSCFNAQQYYEAHDVLEQLWLRCRDGNYPFFKGLIQIAGAFVHLQKQFLHPEHPKHGRRLRPSVRLFHLGMRNIEPFAPSHLHLDVTAVLELCRHYSDAVAGSDFTINPWNPAHPPHIELLPA